MFNLFDCVSQKPYSNLPLHSKENCKCKAWTVDSLDCEILSPKSQRKLQKYLEIVNSNCEANIEQRISVLTSEDQQILKALLLKVHLYQYYMI